jgi:3-methyladenine DNA glycosylase AlkD
VTASRPRAAGLATVPSIEKVGRRLDAASRTADVRRVARGVARSLRAADPRAVVRLAEGLIATGRRHGAYEILACHPLALASLRASNVEVLGRGIESWGFVDAFACFVAGPAWRERQISDARVHRWARSRDRWWRRAAVVCTVPLNARSRGGRGDARRTLAVCERVVADRDPMVTKALSWALRELSKQDAPAVERFLRRHGSALASLVVREVRNKLTTGRKHP